MNCLNRVVSGCQEAAMAAKFRSEDGPFASHRINQPAGQKSAFNGSISSAQKEGFSIL
jgi:hypothetical protein